MDFTSLNGYNVKDKTARENIEALKQSYLIDEIEYFTIPNSNSKSIVHIVHIPHTDNNGNEIKLQHGFANDEIDTGLETPSNFSNRHKTTLTINASVFETEGTPDVPINTVKGLYIHNGIVLKDNRQYLPEDFLKNRYILGITESGLLKSYIGNTPSQTILNDGVIETVQAFIPILVNGENNRQNLVNAGTTYWGEPTFIETEDEEADYNKIYYILQNGEYVGVMNIESFNSGVTYYEEVTNEWNRYARQIIAQNSQTLDYYVITSEGKGKSSNIGLSLNEFLTIAKHYGCDFAFVLDGGGSTATIYQNIMVNNTLDNTNDYHYRTDGKGLTERSVPDFLYFAQDTQTEIDENINNILNKINLLKREINNLELNFDEKFFNPINFYEKELQQQVFNFKRYNPNTKNFEDSMRIYFDNQITYPGGLSIEDVTNGIEHLLRIHNNKNEGISFLDTQLALFPDKIPQVNDSTLNLDNLTPTASAMMLNTNLNLTNQPFDRTTESVNLYWLIQWGGDYYKFQIAIAVKREPIIKVRTKVDGAWNLWKTITMSY